MTGMQPPRHAIAWYGEPGDVSRFVVALPASLRDRYSATGRVRFTTDPIALDILALTLTDHETGATVRLRGQRATVSVAGDAAGAYVSRFWKVAREVISQAHRDIGRPVGTGNVRDDDQIREIVGALRATHTRRITLGAIAAYSGAFTRDNLRYYMTTNGRRLSDYL